MASGHRQLCFVTKQMTVYCTFLTFACRTGTIMLIAHSIVNKNKVFLASISSGHWTPYKAEIFLYKPWPNVLDVAPTLYKCYTNVFCLLECMSCCPSDGTYCIPLISALLSQPVIASLVLDQANLGPVEYTEVTTSSPCGVTISTPPWKLTDSRPLPVWLYRICVKQSTWAASSAGLIAWSRLLADWLPSLGLQPYLPAWFLVHPRVTFSDCFRYRLVKGTIAKCQPDIQAIQVTSHGL